MALIADLTLSDGTEITFDLTKVTYKQWKGVWNPREADEDSDATIARAAGLTLETLEALPLPDAKALVAAFRRRGTEPLAAPNSVRASTSD